jgi:hypothetical protein
VWATCFDAEWSIKFYVSVNTIYLRAGMHTYLTCTMSCGLIPANILSIVLVKCWFQHLNKWKNSTSYLIRNIWFLKSNKYEWKSLSQCGHDAKQQAQGTTEKQAWLLLLTQMFWLHTVEIQTTPRPFTSIKWHVSFHLNMEIPMTGCYILHPGLQKLLQWAWVEICRKYLYMFYMLNQIGWDRWLV